MFTLFSATLFICNLLICLFKIIITHYFWGRVLLFCFLVMSSGAAFSGSSQGFQTQGQGASLFHQVSSLISTKSTDMTTQIQNRALNDSLKKVLEVIMEEGSLFLVNSEKEIQIHAPNDCSILKMEHGDKVSVKVSKYCSLTIESPEFVKVIVHLSKGTLTARSSEKKQFEFNGDELDIKLIGNSNKIKAKINKGKILLKGARFHDLDLETESAPIVVLEGIVDNIVAQTYSSDIRINAVKERGVLFSRVGNIFVGGEAQHLKVKTLSGKINLSELKNDSYVVVKSLNGTVDLTYKEPVDKGELFLENIEGPSFLHFKKGSYCVLNPVPKSKILVTPLLCLSKQKKSFRLDIKSCHGKVEAESY